LVTWCVGQGDINDRIITIESWQKGNRTIPEKTTVLNIEADEYNWEIANSERSLEARLKVNKIYVPTIRKPNLQCVAVSLNELFETKESGLKALGSNMLLSGNTVERPAHVLCPIEKPSMALYGGLYAFKAERVFLIEGFVFRIKGEEFAYDPVDNRLTKMRLLMSIERRVTDTVHKKVNQTGL
jgi:hypothetical protein